MTLDEDAQSPEDAERDKEKRGRKPIEALFLWAHLTHIVRIGDIATPGRRRLREPTIHSRLSTEERAMDRAPSFLQPFDHETVIMFRGVS